ncbi:MAG: hypothetical protein HUU16_12730 [Candidatus Omnitrophica bacterium]|nr:hypothetical protein [Candidatus Omnitrophota bacterium]
MACLCFEAQGEISAPVLVSPQNGEVVQLSAPPNEITLLWGNVAGATGYLILITGPEEFGEPLEIEVAQSAQNPISRGLNNLVTGTYTWKVTAFGEGGSAESSTSFFTIQTGSGGGGNLPAPAPLLPPDLVILRGDSGLIRFQWTRVEGASSYRLNISPPAGFFVSVSQPPSGTKVTTSRPFTQAQAGSYKWSVAAVDNQMRVSPASPERQFVFTSLASAGWDLDESGGPTPEDFFGFQANWQRDFTLSDLNLDGETNGDDAALMIQSQAPPGLPTPTPIPGFFAPTPIQPLANSQVPQTGIDFTWQTVIGALGYEFNLLDDNPNSNIVRVIEQSTTSTVSTQFTSLPIRPLRWRVRAFFGAGVVGPYSTEIPFTVVE